MAQAILAAIYVMASATLALALSLFGIAQGPAAALIGLAALLATAQVHSTFTRRAERRRIGRELTQLRRASKDFARALDETHAKIEEVSAAVEARASAQSKKVVAELQVLESLMREFAAKISQKAKQVPIEEPEIIERRTHEAARSQLHGLGESGLLETIRASLEENRVDLYLQPIVSLPQRKLRYYEALSRLRAEDGTVIMPSQYIRIAAPAGLMSVVDNLLLFRCVQIVRRLVQKNREIGMFCNISGDTLADAEFFPQFLEYMHHNRDLAQQIVFEFAQAAVFKAGHKGEKNLHDLSSLGFGLSMDHVETLAMDFAKLKSLGFRHVKVRAQTLTGGMDGARAAVAAEDLKKLLERHGLNLIAERVEDEKTVVQLRDYNVDFAQGFLFGEPRPARDDQIKTLPDTLAPVIPFRKTA